MNKKKKKRSLTQPGNLTMTERQQCVLNTDGADRNITAH